MGRLDLKVTYRYRGNWQIEHGYKGNQGPSFGSLSAVGSISSVQFARHLSQAQHIRTSGSSSQS